MNDVEGYIPHAIYWYGKYYPPGVATIPSDLAIALGLPLSSAADEVVPPVPPDPATRKSTPAKQ